MGYRDSKTSMQVPQRKKTALENQRTLGMVVKPCWKEWSSDPCFLEAMLPIPTPSLFRPPPHSGISIDGKNSEIVSLLPPGEACLQSSDWQLLYTIVNLCYSTKYYKASSFYSFVCLILTTILSRRETCQHSEDSNLRAKWKLRKTGVASPGASRLPGWHTGKSKETVTARLLMHVKALLRKLICGCSSIPIACQKSTSLSACLVEKFEFGQIRTYNSRKHSKVSGLKAKMKGSNSAKEHRRRCLLGRPRLFSPHALQGGMRSRLQWRLCWSCRVMSTPPECFSLSLSLSLTCTYITEQKTRACHMPPVILQVKLTQDLSGSQKKTGDDEQ